MRVRFGLVLGMRSCMSLDAIVTSSAVVASPTRRLSMIAVICIFFSSESVVVFTSSWISMSDFALENESDQFSMSILYSCMSIILSVSPAERIILASSSSFVLSKLLMDSPRFERVFSHDTVADSGIKSNIILTSFDFSTPSFTIDNFIVLSLVLVSEKSLIVNIPQSVYDE